MIPPGKIVAVRISDSRFLVSAQTLVAVLVLVLAISAGFSWAFESCHIHPPGRNTLESEWSKLPLYSSLDECESANAKYFGGTERCHCFQDFSPRVEGEIWPQPRRDFETPPRDPRP
jgi:hypothetical protein